MLFKYHERGLLHQSPLLCSHSAESNRELMLNSGGGHSFHAGDIYISLVPEAQGSTFHLLSFLWDHTAQKQLVCSF